MKLTLSTLDILEVFLYLIIMLFIGSWHFLRKDKSADEFMDGGRSFSHWSLGISIFATWMSSMAIISLPALVYSTNWSYFIIFMGIPIAAIFVTKIIIPVFRKEGSVSAYSYLGTRFGSWAPFWCVICYALTNLLRLGIIMYLMATAIGYLSGYHEKWIILIIGGVVIFYTFMGGLRSVISTDVIQAVLFFSGTVFLLIFIIYSLPCTFKEAIIYANKNGKLSFGSSEMSFFEPSIWILGLNSLLLNFQGLGTEQGFVQRYMAAKNKECANKSAIIGSLLVFIFASVLFIIGTLLFTHYNYKLGVIGDVINDEYVILRYIAENMPLGVRGIIIVTIMAAAMSSIDTEINAIATLFYKHIWRKRLIDDHKCNALSVLYGSCIIIGIIPIVIAFFMIEKSNLLDAWNNFDSLFSGMILGLFIVSLSVKNGNKNVAIISAIFGLLVVVWLILSQILLDTFKNSLHPVYNILLLLSVMLISGCAAHMVMTRKRPNQPILGK